MVGRALDPQEDGKRRGLCRCSMVVVIQRDGSVDVQGTSAGGLGMGLRSRERRVNGHVTVQRSCLEWNSVN